MTASRPPWATTSIPLAIRLARSTSFLTQARNATSVRHRRKRRRLSGAANGIKSDITTNSPYTPYKAASSARTQRGPHVRAGLAAGCVATTSDTAEPVISIRMKFCLPHLPPTVSSSSPRQDRVEIPFADGSIVNAYGRQLRAKRKTAQERSKAVDTADNADGADHWLAEVATESVSERQEQSFQPTDWLKGTVRLRTEPVGAGVRQMDGSQFVRGR
ncbi:hypothetical protein CI41S_20300 [Bradyrhizobium ivorense]|nr:hypothetical protein CI41S_20300 [Bradyrhizobium ivorense]